MFSYLGVLISVILGLALTHLLVGVSKMIQLRESVRVYWVQVVWTINVILYVLALWWGMFWWNKLQVWTIEEFLFIIGYSIVIFMLASMLFPWDFAAGLDFEQHFFANKSWFFGIFLTATLLDIPETLEKGVSNLREVPRQYVIFIPVSIAILIAALFSKNRRLHGVLGVLWLTLILAYLAFTSLSRIAAS
jgi:hypothetical protein